MSARGVANDALARHLHAAIERVRVDMKKIEVWADAVGGFSEPVPDYDSTDAKVWLPSEQATTIPANQDVAHKRSRPSKRR